MNKFYFDIETLPGARRPDPEEIKAPANYRDPAKILAYQEAKVEEVYRRQALDSMEGQVLAVGFAFGDGPTECIIQGKDGICTERGVLAALEERLAERGADFGPPVFVGHNVRAFDLAWIWRKAIKHRLTWLSSLIPRERYSSRVVDTMELWASDFKDRVSLAAIAEFLGLEGKTEGVDGSKIFDLFEAGEIDLIHDYCKQDVELTRAVYKRIQGAA